MTDPTEQHGDEREVKSGADGDVVIPREDLQVIVDGLKVMPDALNKMADSVGSLADNINRSPSKSYMTTILVIAVLFLGLVLGGGLYRQGEQIKDLQEAQAVGATRGIETNKLVKKIEDCIDVIESEVDGDTKGECAQQLEKYLVEAFTLFRQDIKCESQVTFIHFIQANPDLGVAVPPVEPSCQSYLDNRVGG
jgi:hypothetical protein